jgi:hypothetical protein
MIKSFWRQVEEINLEEERINATGGITEAGGKMPEDDRKLTG